jgi:hypothetical protein
MFTLGTLSYTPGNKSAQISKASEAWWLVGSRDQVEEWTKLLSAVAPFRPAKHQRSDDCTNALLSRVQLTPFLILTEWISDLAVFSYYLGSVFSLSTNFIFDSSHQHLENTEAKRRTSLLTLLVSSIIISRKVVVHVHDPGPLRRGSLANIE